MLPTLCNTAHEYIRCHGGLWSSSHRFWGTSERGKRGEKFNIQTILLKKYDLAICTKVITHIKKHPVGDSGSNLFYLELGFGFLQTVSNETCSTTRGHLCKSIPWLNEGIGGGDSSWHLHLAKVSLDGRVRILHSVLQSYSKQNWFSCRGPANWSQPLADFFVPAPLSLLENGCSAEFEFGYWHKQPQRSVPACPDARNNSVDAEYVKNILI